MDDALRAEAHDRRTSMNQLCISKLLQMIDEQLVPADVPNAGRQAKTQVVVQEVEGRRICAGNAVG